MTTRSLRRAALALATALSGIFGTVAVAHADSFRHQDAIGDVVITTTGSPGTGYVSHFATLPDLVNLSVLHSRWTLSVATVIRTVDGYGTTWTATIVTSKSERFQVIYYRNRAAAPATVVHVSLVHNGHRSTCDGLHVSRTSPTATSKGVVAKVPTRCLGNPWKVRVGVQTHTTYGDGTESHLTVGHDDVLRNGAFTYYKPALSPWIAR